MQLINVGGLIAIAAAILIFVVVFAGVGVAIQNKKMTFAEVGRRFGIIIFAALFVACGSSLIGVLMLKGPTEVGKIIPGVETGLNAGSNATPQG